MKLFKTNTSEMPGKDSDMVEDTEQNDFYDDYDFNDEVGTQPIEKHADLLKKLTDFKPYLKEIVMEWLGMYWNEETKKYEKDPNVSPIMNIKGARWSVNFLRTYARDNNIITNIATEDTFKNIMEDVIDTAFLNIGTRSEEFGITNDGDIMLVCNQLVHATELVLIGAGGNKSYTDFLSATAQWNSNVQVADRPISEGQKQGIWSTIKKYLP